MKTLLCATMTVFAVATTGCMAASSPSPSPVEEATGTTEEAATTTCTNDSQCSGTTPFCTGLSLALNASSTTQTINGESVAAGNFAEYMPQTVGECTGWSTTNSRASQVQGSCAAGQICVNLNGGAQGSCYTTCTGSGQGTCSAGLICDSNTNVCSTNASACASGLAVFGSTPLTVTSKATYSGGTVTYGQEIGGSAIPSAGHWVPEVWATTPSWSTKIKVNFNMQGICTWISNSDTQATCTASDESWYATNGVDVCSYYTTGAAEVFCMESDVFGETGELVEYRALTTTTPFGVTQSALTAVSPPANFTLPARGTVPPGVEGVTGSSGTTWQTLEGPAGTSGGYAGYGGYGGYGGAGGYSGYGGYGIYGSYGGYGGDCAYGGCGGFGD